jgi:transcriptional regulator with XRE-family HTH domain
MAQVEIAVLAANVARLRHRKKLTQAQLAQRTGIHYTEISRIERGLRDLRLSTLVRLARALNVKPGRLLERS